MSERTESIGDTVLRWWCGLHHNRTTRGETRAAIARLRRAATLYEVLAEPETINLYERVKRRIASKHDHLVEHQIDAVAILAATLTPLTPSDKELELFAEKKFDKLWEAASNHKPLAERLGLTVEGRKPDETEKPLLSPLRFGALIRARTEEERLRHLRRAFAILGREATFNVPRFADDIFFWGDRTKREWIFQYYQKGADIAADDDQDQTSDREESLS